MFNRRAIAIWETIPKWDGQMTEDASASSWVDLRRADWRFLLPAPREGFYQHLVLLGGHPDLAKRLRDTGVAWCVSEQFPVGSPADVVAILHGAATPTTIRQAIGALAPGGSLYCEVDRRLAGGVTMTPARLRRLLEAHALSLTGLYWPVPGFAAGKRYVPLDLTGPLHWYFNTLYVNGTRSHQLFEHTARSLIGDQGAWFSRIVPWYALTASTDGSSSSSVLGDANCPRELQHSGSRPFLITMGIDEGSRVALLPFVDHADLPEIVFKVARLPEVNTNVESEQFQLANLRERLDGPMRRTIPAPLGEFTYGNLAVGIESCAPGSSVLVSSGRWRSGTAEKLSDLRLTANWLSTFHQHVQLSAPEYGAADLSSRIERTLARYVDVFGHQPGEDRLFAMVRARMRVLGSVPLPIVWRHGDFGPWNIYRAGNDLTVIDWEVRHGLVQDPAGPPLCDLLYFVTYWSFVARRIYGPAPERRGFRELFLESDRTDVMTSAIWVVIDDYLTRLTIDRRFVSPLLVYTWVKRALEELDRNRVLDIDQPNAAYRSSNQFVDWIGMLAEKTERLFPDEAAAHVVVAERDAGGRRVVSR